MELAGEHAPDLMDALVADDLVASLLLVHGLHPESLDNRVEAALASVRPFLAQHGGDVELLGIDEDRGAVRLRLLGSCDGCPSSAVTLQGRRGSGDRGSGARDRPHRRRRPGAARPPACRSRWGKTKTVYDDVPGRDGGVRVMTDPLAVLQRIRQTRPREVPRPGEVCELCAEPIADEHGHLVDLQARTLLCACRGCYLLFVSDGAGGAHFRAVPDRYVAFPDFALSPAQWDTLQIPVSVAFFFLNSSLGRVAAFYPRPAGATESELPLDTWAEITPANPGSGRSNPTSRRSWCGPARTTAARSATSSRSTPATSWSATCASCGGASTAARRPTPSSTPSSTTSGSRAR